MRLRLYDSLSRRASEVEPRDPGVLTAYICGPTVYGYIHVGNARPFWLGQVLKRFVEQRLGERARIVGNITDINDRIYVRARELGVPSGQLAQEMADAYREDTSRLGLGRPDVEPLATESLPEIVELIERLIERGLAYEAGGDVYFRVERFPGYGALSGQRTDELVQGERVEPGEGKESPLDFALWKATKPDEDTSWPSPWGDGRPGWHIECSAMAHQHLGPGFDVHGGGLDLVFPHHENERAQSEGAGEPFAQRWMHNGMLRLSSEKMSKSLGNVERLRDALDRVGHETLKTFFARAHYRSPVDYDDDALEQAARANDRFREALRAARRYAAAGAGGADQALRGVTERHGEAFDDALADDLNTPEALAALHGFARELNTAVAEGRSSAASVSDSADALVACLDVLGLAGLDPRRHARDEIGGLSEISAVVISDGTASEEDIRLASLREVARRERDFPEADALRDQLIARGWAVRDTPQGPELVPLDR